MEVRVFKAVLMFSDMTVSSAQRILYVQNRAAMKLQNATALHSWCLWFCVEFQSSCTHKAPTLAHILRMPPHRVMGPCVGSWVRVSAVLNYTNALFLLWYESQWHLVLLFLGLFSRVSAFSKIHAVDMGLVSWSIFVQISLCVWYLELRI